MQFQITSIVAAIVATLTISSVTAAPASAGHDLVKRGHSYSGTATWYKPATEGGPEAACNGEHIDNDSQIVALNADQYGDLDSKSKWCGKKIRIKGEKGTATATILDACPECSEGDLDLTPSLFKKVVGDMDAGVGDITWEVI
ncbi:RlpA-like double-psi beta-barrel-protein domain-containing protein-containing protein [Mycotypha africana]|uniref:RlpA-like double-psi beta-barrel-protein domain-containing protein-containing protein n=1 Tax=Mycotypha africana TaxID=64632 RepID=UPI002300250C|nr:RlpA-like double-psi beta-barrel-protein domain-containing protein-containing protein [Mycotypha africana]KAI8975095.1 RlpA-like double-psi beta-barrel-protein domain-containing protein-containing protein [Mycotypha africana]